MTPEIEANVLKLPTCAAFLASRRHPIIGYLASHGEVTATLALGSLRALITNRMRTAYLSIFLLACFSVSACSQSICSDGSAGNCSSGDNSAGADGSTSGVTCDDPNAVVCESQCVDTDVNPTFCGDCGTSCAEGQGCSAGGCVDLCDPGLVNCGGTCIDPQNNGDFCGASGTCSIDTQGEDCAENACSNGTCVAQRYLGSLPPTTGRWNYGGTLGVAGAEEQCRVTFAATTATVCSYANLLDAQAKNELVTPLDSAGAPVTSWYILDATQNIQRQCTKTDAENIPWTYETADLGEGSRIAEVSTAGAVGAVIDNPSPDLTYLGCRGLRNVPCCLP